MQKCLVVVLAAVLLAGLVPAVSAENYFAHHLDVLQVTTHDAKPKTLDLGYHFTVFRVAERIELFGAGGGLDFYPDGKDAWGYAQWKGSPFFIGHLVGVQLGNPHDFDEGGLTLGASYIYHVRYREHRVAIGFSVAWK